MEYYKEIVVNDYDIIVNKTLQYVKETTSLAEVPVPYNWHEVNYSQFIQYVPELRTAFLQYNLTPAFVAIFVVHDNRKTSVHKDSYPYGSRVNFPILNCAGTYTNFYKNVKFEEYVNPFTGVISYSVVNTDYELVDRVEIKTSTLIRVHEAHKVDVPDNNPIPRITLTVGFNRDPSFLFDI